MIVEEPEYGQNNKKILFYFDEIIGTFQYVPTHPMKPFRVAMTNELVEKYGLYKYLDIYESNFCDSFLTESIDQIFTKFHSDDYIELIKTVNPDNKHIYEDQLYRYNFGEDCPVIDRLYEYCTVYTQASVVAAKLLNDKKYDIAINWSGGFHHAKQSEASGFCYVNDIVLAILELLKVYHRVLYIDIDIHHGDGVEEAFYTTDRVLTCSFHKFRDYFPGTGHVEDIGYEKGKFHSVNFPLNQGVDDESFKFIFEPTIDHIMEKYNPDAIVLQCGADSLSGDRLGCFNLSIKGHGACVSYVKKFGRPLFLCGGGGYTLRNVARCWAYETALAVGVDLPNNMPENEYIEYFAPEYKLHLPCSNMENQNDKSYLSQNLQQIVHNLKKINTSGVQITHYNDNVEMTRQSFDIQEFYSKKNDEQEEIKMRIEHQ